MLHAINDPHGRACCRLVKIYTGPPLPLDAFDNPASKLIFNEDEEHANCHGQRHEEHGRMVVLVTPVKESLEVEAPRKKRVPEIGVVPEEYPLEQTTEEDENRHVERTKENYLNYINDLTIF